MPVEDPTSPSPLWRRLFWPLAIAGLVLSASHRSDIAAPAVTNIDKFSHFAVFGLLGTLLCRLGQGWRAAAWALLAVSAFGAADEYHQSFVPGRSPEVADWIADTLGATVAVTFYAGWGAYRRLLEAPLWRRRHARAGLDPAIR